MTKASKWGLTVLLMLLMAACSSEMPLPGDPDANSVVAPRNLLPLQQVPRRIGAMWASLPRQTLTRAGDEPVVDSVFSVPVGDFLAAYDASTNTWVENPEIEQIDTISTYGYAVTFQNQSGFVIVSAQEGLPDLLFYTEDGNYADAVRESHHDPGNPGGVGSGQGSESGFTVFMDVMTAWAAQRVSEDPTDPNITGGGNKVVYGAWQNTVNADRPLPVSWGQQDPFNRYCYDQKGNKAMAGCVAVALAQVMALYRFPESYNGYTFNWPAMEMVSNVSGFEWGKEDVARLMKYLGNADNLQTIYGPKLSTSQPDRICPTLVNFGYASTCVMEPFAFSELKAEIDAGHPVIVCGYTKKNVGHAWVADGYFIRSRELKYAGDRTEEERYEYVHCNWGNNGSGNGYALATVFDPRQAFRFPGEENEQTVSKESYCHKTKIVTGIRPQ